jgi:hypothetical protein
MKPPVKPPVKPSATVAFPPYVRPLPIGKQPTGARALPEPVGGWGVPVIDEETGALTFSIPAASMTPELEAYITRPSSAATTQTPDGYRAARAARVSPSSLPVKPANADDR